MQNGMVVLIDTNVVINFLLKREPFSESATKIFQKCAEKEIIGYLAFHSIPNIWYILRKISESKRREWLKDICSILCVTGASHAEVLKAITNKEFRDLEDCLQGRCAKSREAKYIITRNVKDFDGSEVPAIIPEEFLEMIGNKKRNICILM